MLWNTVDIVVLRPSKRKQHSHFSFLYLINGRQNNQEISNMFSIFCISVLCLTIKHFKMSLLWISFGLFASSTNASIFSHIWLMILVAVALKILPFQLLVGLQCLEQLLASVKYCVFSFYIYLGCKSQIQ